jgi:hypothetical protein
MAEHNCENCAREDCIFIPPVGEVHCGYWRSDTPAVNRWILCEDELPERDTNVLIYYPAWKDAPVQTAHIMIDGSCWEFSDGEFYPSMKDITHWMPLPPLPEPPEKE